MKESLPAAIPANFGEDESFLKALHHVLLEVRSPRARLPASCAAFSGGAGWQAFSAMGEGGRRVVGGFP